MSLINDMLRDLEQRRDMKTGWETAAGAVGFKEPNKYKRMMVLCGLIAVGIAGGILIYEMSPGTVQEPVPPTSAARQADTIETLPVPVIADRQDGDMIPVATSLPPEVSVTPETKAVLELAGLDLVTGADVSVFTLHFSKIPEYRLEQHNNDSQRLVIAFPAAVIGHQLAVPDFPPDSLLKEFSLKPGDKALLLLVDLNHNGVIDSVQTQTSDGEFLLQITIKRIAQEKTVVENPAKPVETHAPVVGKLADPLAIDTSSVVEQTMPGHAKIDKITPKTEPGVSAYQTGLQQLGQGQLRAARDSFYQSLNERPGYVEARMQLIGLLQQQHRIQEANQVLHQGLDVAPGDPTLRKLMARQLMATKNFEQGIKLLTQVPLPELSRDQEYYALLAVMYHDAGQYQPGLKTYQDLVTVQPANATWWFGLALCADQVGDSSSAKQAYQSALQLPALRANLQAYARQRLQQL